MLLSSLPMASRRSLIACFSASARRWTRAMAAAIRSVMNLRIRAASSMTARTIATANSISSLMKFLIASTMFLRASLIQRSTVSLKFLMKPTTASRAARMTRTIAFLISMTFCLIQSKALVIQLPESSTAPSRCFSASRSALSLSSWIFLSLPSFSLSTLSSVCFSLSSTSLRTLSCRSVFLSPRLLSSWSCSVRQPSRWAVTSPIAFSRSPACVSVFRPISASTCCLCLACESRKSRSLACRPSDTPFWPSLNAAWTCGPCSCSATSEAASGGTAPVTPPPSTATPSPPCAPGTDARISSLGASG